MSLSPRVIAEGCAAIGLLPIAWIVVLTVRGQKRAPQWWWMAGVFLIGWMADMLAGHVMDPDVVGNVYPLSQAALVGAILLDRQDAVTLLVVLMMVAFVGLVVNGPLGVDVLLRTAAWGTIAWMAWNRPHLAKLRYALLVSFALGWACWVAYALAPGWTTYGVYQAVRLLGVLGFCWSAMQTGPNLRVSRA